jgi:hypothetical protein
MQDYQIRVVEERGWNRMFARDLQGKVDRLSAFLADTSAPPIGPQERHAMVHQLVVMREVCRVMESLDQVLSDRIEGFLAAEHWDGAR